LLLALLVAGTLPAARAGLTPQSCGSIACVVLWQAAIINNSRGKHPKMLLSLPAWFDPS